MEKIKLVALDLDGTLLNSKKQPPADFSTWITENPELIIVLASGRQYATLRQQFASFSERLSFIADNGAFIFHQGKMIFSSEMNHKGVLDCITMFESIPGCHVALCGAKSAYIGLNDSNAVSNYSQYYANLEVTSSLEACLQKDCIGKIAVLVDNKRAEELLHILPEVSPEFKFVLSGTEWIDVSNKDADKGNAIRKLQEMFDISPDACMAFGDYLNDRELLSAVTESYAMGNAHPELKAIAKYVTDTNDNDGVMLVLRQLNR